MKLFAFLMLVTAYTPIFSQGYQVLFKIYNYSDKKPIPNAEVRIKEGGRVKNTDTRGNSEFQDFKVGDDINYEIVADCCNKFEGSFNISNDRDKNVVIVYMHAKSTDGFLVNLKVLDSDSNVITGLSAVAKIGNINKAGETDEYGEFTFAFNHNEFEITENTGIVKIKIGNNRVVNEKFVVPRSGGVVYVSIVIPTRNVPDSKEGCEPKIITIFHLDNFEYLL